MNRTAPRSGWFDAAGDVHMSPAWLESWWAMPILVLAGVLLLEPPNGLVHARLTNSLRT